MDAVNRQEDDLRRDPGLAVVASSPPQSPYYDSTQLHQQQHARPNDQPIYALSADSDPLNDTFPVFLHDSSFDLSAPAHAADNLDAVASNATVLAPGGSPDDYYRTYRGLDTATHHHVASTTHDPMASAISNSRQNLPSRSTSTSNGTAPKLPAVAGNRIGIRPIHRSASNPVDDRFAPSEPTRIRSATGNAVPGGAARASVKDMKKKFEQNGGQSPAEPRRSASRATARDGAAKMTNGRPAAGPPQSYTSLRTTATNAPNKSNAPPAQRSKFLPEDHVSSNTQSFSSRIKAPKPTAPARTQSSRSTTSPNKQSSRPPATSGGPLLFGEIRQQDVDAETPGFGIQEGPGQRPPESTPPESSKWQHQRSQSDAMAEPASPTDWYRGAGSPEKKNPPKKTDHSSQSHSRSQSDLAGARLPPLNTNSQHRKRVEQSPSPHPASSRLPVLNKKVGTASNPASPASTRSNSPAGARRLVPSGRASRQQSQATSRAKTPVSRPKTPSGASAARRAPAAQSSNNARLAAVISPPPKLSPPLRSSRPRQPVSQATTASSRLKAIDRSRSPNKAVFRPSGRPDSRQETPANRRRKLSLGGPVDFAQRRETIKLKYSKSIRETEAKQARDAAAEKRKKELEAAAKAKARAQARAEAQVAAVQAAASSQAKEPAKTPSNPRDVGQEQGQRDPIAVEAVGDQPLVVDTRPTSSADRAHPPALVLDSPTLGLPGTFPSFGSSPPTDKEEAPPSATSETSAVTEFDHEAQTEPPVPEQQSAQLLVPEPPPNPASAETVEDSATPQRDSTYERATYRDPFEDITEDESIPIKISLEPSSPPKPLVRSMSNVEPSMPGAFTDDQDAVSECESQSCFEHRPEIHSKTAAETEEQAALQQKADPYATLRDEYEPQPYVAPPYHTTTVTIISRDTGFGSSPYIPQEGLEDVQPQAEPLMDSLEDFYTGPRLKDNVASLRDSTFTASDSGSGEAQHTPDTSNSLNVPSMTTPANRLSQHSVWTDLSYSSRDSRPLDYFGDQRGGSVAGDSRPQSMRDDDSSFRRRYFSDGADEESVSGHQRYRTLPDVDPRAAFSGSYAPGSERVPQVPKLPDHSPPPPPPENESRPASGYYEDRRPDSYAAKDDPASAGLSLSRRESEDYHNQSSAGQSLDGVTPAQTPLEEDRRLSEDNAEESGPVRKEKNRLRQRELVIREIVDTEAAFVRDMNVIEEIYKGTAEACPKLDDKTIKLIFRNSHEIIAFHTAFLSELKDGVTSVYVPRGRRSPALKEETAMSDATTIHSVASTVPSTAPSSTTAVSATGTATTNPETDDSKDRQTVIGPAFIRNIEQMRIAHEGFLRTSDVANKRLIDIQQDPTVQVWLNECNEVAKDLTAAWNLDSLLIKPMQRITKYPNLISQLLQYTPDDHPDRESLLSARVSVETAILEINKTKKNFELVGQIVGRKRKESDVKTGFARAFGKRVDKLQASSNRPAEDPEYVKLNEKFNDDYLRLQVVLRDVEFYTREVSAYVQAFLDYLSAMELVMRLQPSPYPELESKWVQFNVSMRDIKKVTLEQHVSTKSDGLVTRNGIR